MAVVEVTELSDDDKDARVGQIMELLRGLSEGDAVDIIESVKSCIEENLIVGKVNN